MRLLDCGWAAALQKVRLGSRPLRGEMVASGLELGDEMHESSKPKTAQKNAQDLKTQSALAMELPVAIVGAILLAGFLGYLADRWLHTSPWLMITGGGLGFVSSMVEITRRYRPQ